MLQKSKTIMAILAVSLMGVSVASCGSDEGERKPGQVVNGVADTPLQSAVRLYAQRRFQDSIFVYDNSSGLCSQVYQSHNVYEGSDSDSGDEGVHIIDRPCTERVLQLAGVMPAPIPAPEPQSGPTIVTQTPQSPPPVAEGTAPPDVIIVTPNQPVSTPVPRSTTAPAAAAATEAAN